MVDPGDEKPKKVPKEEVSSKQENVDTTPPNPTRTADGGRDVAPRANRGGAGASVASTSLRRQRLTSDKTADGEDGVVSN
ncbi:hypothetical protein ACOSP7_022530 [Xanthoceras sorbifolium]